ncbi:(3S,6E)-nerolidol synthase 1 isoform X2 [Lathyrus oleraceus]|uniref:(3S,6E)-nerolidol synthase 1 isoform X2 n=1 Tax=Pisum sativum TaxID=3888 RepID=UPI0021CEF541|nr:(3S,6E)-nerolidol synthase 1 isoform X2 [Pisum sativum]
MSMHFKSCLSSLKLQIIPTNSQLPKWNIDTVKLKRRNTLIGISSSDKLEVVKHEFKNVGESSLKGLHMIDVMQRLNIDYHFQEEIEAFLTREYVCHHHDLHEIALRFRLLRQRGHFVPSEVFNKFKNKEEKFDPKLGENIKGMIDLFEASHLSMAEEDILDGAKEFSMKILKEKVAQLDNREAMFVRKTLEYPFHKTLPMFTSRNFYYGHLYGTNKWFDSLKELAKVDFSFLQHLRHQEIIEISKWWKELGLANELPFARNQPLKWYMWSLACLVDPTLSEERIELTKPISLIHIIDDIFDIYGTLDELTLFTEAVSSWNIDTAMEKLPNYMKPCFRALYDQTNEISSKIYEKHALDPKDSLQNTWKTLCKAFLVEAKWFASGKMPSAEEYLKNGIVSCGVHVVLVHLFFILGKGITKQNIDKLDTIPPIISSPATILRLWDDLGNAEDENQQGNDGSYVSCLMMDQPEYYCRRKATDEAMTKICNAWRSLNQECLFDSHFNKEFRNASLNLARMVPLMYSYDDQHSLIELEDQVHSLLYDKLL